MEHIQILFERGKQERIYIIPNQLLAISSPDEVGLCTGSMLKPSPPLWCARLFRCIVEDEKEAVQPMA